MLLLGLVRFGMVWFGLVWIGLVRHFSVDSLIDQLVEISVVIRTSKVGNTTVVVVSEVGGTAGAHRANKVVPLLGPEISETIHK